MKMGDSMNSVITVLIVKYGRKLDISMERQKSREKKKPLRNTRTTSQSF